MADANGQSSNKISLEANDEKNFLGEGGFGQVYRGYYGESPAAIKRMIVVNLPRDTKETLPYDKKLKHEYVVQIYGIERDSNFLYLAMELCAGTLEELIDGTYTGPSPGTKSEVMLQVTLGLKYLHDNHIVHRDLNPRNILISLPGNAGSINTPPKMKLTDFGLCKELAHDNKSALVSKSAIGTAGWQPPEYYPVEGSKRDNRRQDCSADIFALGCIFGYTFTGGWHPFGNDRYNRPINIRNAKLDWKNEERIVDSSMKDLIKRMIDKERKKRPEMKEILAHRMFVVAHQSHSYIKINDVLVAQYIWLESTIKTEGMNTFAVPGDSASTLSIQHDMHGQIIQPVYRLLKWTMFDSPPQLEEIYLPQVTQIARLLAGINQLLEDEDNKRAYRKQIIRRALLFDVRMPKWLTSSSEAVITNQEAVKKALETLPETHQAAFTGDCEHLIQLEASDDGASKVWSQVFCWNRPSSTSSDAPNSEEPNWRLFYRTGAAASDGVMEDGANDFISDQMCAQKRMTEAWMHDRIPPAYYLAAPNGQSEFCKKAIEAVRNSEQHKQKLKDFVIELIYYALYVANNESLALECLDYATCEFSEGEFFEMFPCAPVDNFTNEQSALVRLTMNGWYEFMSAGIYEWNRGMHDKGKMWQLEEALFKTLTYAIHSESRKYFVDIIRRLMLHNANATSQILKLAIRVMSEQFRKLQRVIRQVARASESNDRDVEIIVNFDKILGEGYFGFVYEGLFGATAAAIKQISSDVFSAHGEIWLRNLDDENIVQFYGLKEDKERGVVFVAMELCAGTLEDLIDGTYTGPSPGTMEQMMLQVTLGLQYLHDIEIAHRDLKPQNILISLPAPGNGAGLNASPPKMKLADFGLCKKLDYSGRSHATASRSRIGTDGWAPILELLSNVAEKGSTDLFSVDIFSLGCVFGFAFTGGCHPFGNEARRRLGNILSGTLAWENEERIIDPSLGDLIKRMIDIDPKNRPKLNEILAHPTFVAAHRSHAPNKLNMDNVDIFRDILSFLVPHVRFSAGSPEAVLSDLCAELAQFIQTNESHQTQLSSTFELD